jgi:hypothetical protein
MICPYCHQEHPDGALFCPITGQKIMPADVTCPRCAKTSPADVRFCPYCGQVLGETVSPGPVYTGPAQKPAGLRWLAASAAVLVVLSLAAAAVYWALFRQQAPLEPAGLEQPASSLTEQGEPISKPGQSAAVPIDTAPEEPLSEQAQLTETMPVPKASTPNATASSTLTNTPSPTITPSPAEVLITATAEPAATQPPAVLPTAPEPTTIAEAGLIAFNSNRAGNNDIYVMNIDGSGVTRITHSPYDERVPAWSPDGRQIAYQSNEGGSYNLTVYNLDTGRARQVTSTDCNDYNPVWSPEGEWLAFYSDCDGNREIYVIRSDGSGRRQLTHTSSIYNWFPNWSPDGRQITFSSNRSGRYEVYIMNADGSGVRALGRGCVSAFSPDGQYLVFAQYCTDTGQIYLIRADGTGLRTLLEEENNANPSWSPDGEWVLFQSERTGDEEIFMIRLDGSELKQLTFDPGRDSAPVWQPVPVPFPEGMRAKVRDGETLTAGYLSSPPQIDGRLDEWRLPRVPVTAVVFEEANHSGPADLSAELMLGWDEGYLYIALDIRDDRYVQNATGDKLFQGDYIDILLDTELEADFSDEKLSDDDFQIGLSLGSDLRAPENYLWYPINRKGEKTGLKFAGLLTLRGYTVEIAIPWKIFLLEPLSGGIYGFALSIGDDDLVDINRLETMVSTVPNRKLTNPTTWGNLSLEKAP